MPFCIKLSEILLNLDEEQKKNFISLAVQNGYDDFVDLRVEEVGLSRKQDTYALVPVTFKGTKQTRVSKGTIVSTLDNRLYYLTEDIVLDDAGLGQGICKAQYSGSKYNVKKGEICYLPIKYVGVNEVINEEDYGDAYDIETNESLYQRYLDFVQNVGTSGNVHNYKKWCLEIEGVGSCDIIPLWAGAGTVKCVITDSNNRKASDDLIQKVKEHLEDVAPIGADVTVSTYSERLIDISLQVVLKDNVDIHTVLAKYKEAVQSYVDEITFTTKTISYSKLICIFMDMEEAVDCSNLIIDGQTDNVKIQDEELIVINDVQFT